MPQIEETAVKEDAAKIKAVISDNTVIAGLYDIDVNILIDGIYAGTITKLNNKITIILDKPAGLPEVPTGYKRIFTVVKVHDGIAVKIATTDNGDTVSCASDEFSTYALTYEDIKEDAASNNNTTSTNTVTTEAAAASTEASAENTASSNKITTEAAAISDKTSDAKKSVNSEKADTAKASNSPKTGDVRIELWITFLLLSILGISGTVLIKKKEF